MRLRQNLKTFAFLGTRYGYQMKSINNYIKIFLTLTFCISAHGKTKFTDRQVAMMIPKYFARDHNAPKITRTRVYGEDGKKVLHLNIEVNRNRY